MNSGWMGGRMGGWADGRVDANLVKLLCLSSCSILMSELLKSTTIRLKFVSLVSL